MSGVRELKLRPAPRADQTDVLRAGMDESFMKFTQFPDGVLSIIHKTGSEAGELLCLCVQPP